MDGDCLCIRRCCDMTGWYKQLAAAALRGFVVSQHRAAQKCPRPVFYHTRTKITLRLFIYHSIDCITCMPIATQIKPAVTLRVMLAMA